jgi:hypothetical protein
MILQLDREPFAKELSFLFVCVNMLSPILGEAIELAVVVIHEAVPLL